MRLRRTFLGCAAWALALVLWGFGLAVNAQAAPSVPLTPGTTDVDAWPAVTLLFDPQGRMTVDDALAHLADFKAPQSTYANLGVQAGAVWLRIPVSRVAGTTPAWILDIDYPSVDSIDAFLVAGGQVTRSVAMGDRLAFADRPVQTRSHSLRILLDDGRDNEILLRVESTSSLLLPIRLMQPDAFQAREDRLQLIQGVLTGIGLCLALYSLAHWFTVRDSMFLYYALDILGSTAFFFALYGLGAQHLWPSNAYLNDHFLPAAALLTTSGSMMFISRALRIEEISLRTAQGLQAGAVLLMACLVAHVVGLIGYRVATTMANAIGLISLLTVVPLAWIRARRGDRAAVYIFVGWCVYAIGVATITALVRGWVGVSLWTQHGYQAATTIEMVMWLLVLGVRMRETREFAERAGREREVMRSMAHTDALTGLLNRRGLQLELEALLSRPAAGRAVAVYLMDLDGFKRVNDTLGHEAGDELLVAVAQRLRDNMRARDVVARLGGDEFVIMAPDLGNDADARRLGDKLIERFDLPFEVAGQPCHVGLTIGYALAPQDGHDAASLLKCADAAMYQGKQAGKHCLRRGHAAGGLTAAA